MIPHAELAHHAFGRTRVRIPEKLKDDNYFVHLEGKFRKISEVTEFCANPKTGSILIHHDHPLEDLLKYAYEEELFHIHKKSAHLDREKKHRGILRRQFTKRVDELDDLVIEKTFGMVDLATLSFVGLMVLGVLQTSRGNLLAPASGLVTDALKLVLEKGLKL